MSVVAMARGAVVRGNGKWQSIFHRRRSGLLTSGSYLSDGAERKREM